MTEPKCPGCGAPVGGFTHIRLKDFRPEPGDRVICGYCRALLICTAYGYRQPTDAELNADLRDPEIQHGIRVVSEFHRQYGAPRRRGDGE